MTTVGGAMSSARLTIKIHRFEVIAAVLASLVVAASALVVTYHLDTVGVTSHCLVQWLTGGPDQAGACYGPVKAWAAINEGEGGKVLAAMALLPYAVGLVLGVPIVGRELEARTAATAWALAGSRRRWLVGRLIPVALLLLLLMVAAGAAAAVLEAARTGDGIWSNAYQDAELFGAPVVAHALAGFGVGLLIGALMGRTLPALIVGAVIAIALFNVGQLTHEAWLPPSLSGGVIAQSVGGTDPAAATRVMDPDLAYRFVTSDGRLLTREAALAAMPPGTTDVGAWLTTHYTPFFEGPSAALTSRWQLLETLAFSGFGGLALLITFPVLERSRPT
jgi:hypothetical protein